MLKPNIACLLKLSDIRLNIDKKLPYIILLAILSLEQFESELNLPIFVEARNVEIQWTFRNYHDVYSIHLLEISINCQFVLIKFLLT